MKKLNSIRTIFLSLCLITGMSLHLKAQRPGGGPGHHRGPDIQQMKADLGLSDEQVSQIEALQTEKRAEMKALRQSEERPSQEEMRAKRQEHRAAMEAILTPAQLEKMKELKQEKRQEHREMKKQAKAAFEAEMLPLIQAQREKFEAVLSNNDKLKIEGLRTELAVLKPQMKALRQQRKEIKQSQAAPSELMHEEAQALKEQKRAIFKQAIEIAQSYESELKALHEEIKPEMEAFHAKMQSQFGVEQGRPGPGHHRRGGMHPPQNGEMQGPGHRGQEGRGAMGPKGQCEGKEKKCKKGERGGKGMGMMGTQHKGRQVARFILMDPNQTGEGLKAEAPELEIFPNPSRTNNTLTYHMATDGDVRIDLLNKDGQILKTVYSGQQTAGSHNIEVDTQALGIDVYYYRVSTKEEEIMKRFTVVN